MASGKKNYFRHSFLARKHPGIAGLIEDLGKEAYFHFFALVEVCAEQASDSFPEDSKFTFRRSTLCRELLVTNSRLTHHLLATTPSLVDHVLVTEKEVVILFPKLRKYMGKYDSKSISNSPKERKEKERKEKESELPSASPVLEIVKPKKTRKKNLPKVQPQETRNTVLFEVEPLQLPEEISAEELSVKVLQAFNVICFKSCQPTNFNLGKINARIKEGYTYEDFVRVIKFKNDEWKDVAHMRAHIVPGTIFCGKFDGYLQAAKSADKPITDPLDDFFAQYAPPVQEGA